MNELEVNTQEVIIRPNTKAQLKRIAQHALLCEYGFMPQLKDITLLDSHDTGDYILFEVQGYKYEFNACVKNDLACGPASIDYNNATLVKKTGEYIKKTNKELFSLACNGKTQELDKISYEQNIDIIYSAFGKPHSLFMGAWRNRQFETCKFFLDIGVLPLNSELIEICNEFEKLYKKENNYENTK